MPPKVTLKRSTPKITFEDASTINEVLLRVTTQHLPESSLSKTSEKLKKAWLPEFRESIVKKIEAHCIDEDEDLLLEDRKMNDRSKDLVDGFLRLDYLESRELVLSERVDSLKAEVLAKIQSQLDELNEKKRKTLSETLEPVPPSPAPKKLDDKIFRSLKSSTERLATHLSAAQSKTNEKTKSLEQVLKGVKKSIELRKSDKASNAASSSSSDLSKSAAVPAATTATRSSKRAKTGDPAKSRFLDHVGAV